MRLELLLRFFYLSVPIYIFYLNVADANNHRAWRWPPLSGWADRQAMKQLYRMSYDQTQADFVKIDEAEFMKSASLRSSPFEHGYLMYQLQEEYRRMVDKYEISSLRSQHVKLYHLELLLYLHEIEMAWWKIEHLSNMMHEIERKYQVPSKFNETYLSPEQLEEIANRHIPKTTDERKIEMERLQKQREEKKHKKQLKKYLETTTKKKSTRWWWPLEYGWEVDDYW